MYLPFSTIAKHFERTESVAGRLASACEDVLYLDFVIRRSFTRAIEHVRQEQRLPDLVLVVRPGSELSDIFKCRVCSFREIL